MRAFRYFGWAEGLSYLLLLCVAMPLKYVAGVPEGVRVLGPVHGVLFVAYLFASYRAARAGRWPLIDLIEAWAASVLPLGPFLLAFGPPGRESAT